jgi:hypothetical protein
MVDRGAAFESGDRLWILERVGWCSLILTLALSLTGLFSESLVSSATAGGGSGAMQVEFDRFVRYRLPAELKIRLPPPGDEDYVELTIPSDYLQAVRIQGTVPLADSVSIGREQVVLRFPRVVVPADGSVTLVVEPREFGGLTVELRSEPGGRVRFWQLVYP